MRETPITRFSENLPNEQGRDEGRRVLFLSKRQYMGKDLIDDAYGRFRELSLELSANGHTVRGVCLSYERRPEATYLDRGESAQVAWTSVNLGRDRFRGLIRHGRVVNRIARDMPADVVIGASDALHVIWAVAIAGKVGALSVVDLYDNFESYAGMSIPGARRQFRRAVVKADIVTCVSEELVRLVGERYGRTGRTFVLENGIPAGSFVPGDQTKARTKLGLPLEPHLAVVAGALSRSRDIETVFKGLDILFDEGDTVVLVVAGPRDEGLHWPERAPILDLGIMDHKEVPDLLRASDVVIVPNLASEFGLYCFPQKAVEAVACARPIVAANTPVMRRFLAEADDGLYDMGSSFDLARAVRERLRDGRVLTRSIDTWTKLGSRLSQVMVGHTP